MDSPDRNGARRSVMICRVIAVAFALCAGAIPPLAVAVQNEPARLAAAAVSQFYAARDGAPAWLNDDQFDDLVRAIERLSDHGLDPQHYHLQALRARRDQPGQREKTASDAWFAAAGHMVNGKLNPLTYEPNWTAGRRTRDLANHLTAALAGDSVLDSLEELAPTFREYMALKTELAHLRRQRDTPIATVPAGAALKSGMSGPRVDALQERLLQLGLVSADAMSSVFDSTTENSVKIFQDSAGLDPDGVVGPATTAKLNMGLQGKTDQLRANLERWRWLPDELGRRHIRVNIAGFSASAYNEGRRERTHLIIVGQRYRKTPVFSDEIEYVVLNPWWETPRSIARKDKLPLFRRDPAAVERQGFQVIDKDGGLVPPASIDWSSVGPDDFPYRIRQSPGPANALGLIKIMFPNKHNVYLHDTPSRGLFSERQRAFSSGCLRTQDPVDLAAWLFEETPGWDKARFDAEIKTGKTKRIDLQVAVPIHVLYFTVVVDSAGLIHYLDDIYQRDPNVLHGLSQPASQTAR